MQTTFGYYPCRDALSAGKIRISPLPDCAETQEKIERSSLVRDGWLYPPPQRSRDMFTGEATELPYPAHLFKLPSTHVINHNASKSIDLLLFLIVCFGFLVGMRTVPEGWGHFYRTPVSPGKLVDFYTSPRELSFGLNYADTFWKKYNKEVRKHMFGAIHLYLACQSYIHDYEQFAFQYTALDTCFKIYSEIALPSSSRVSHALRAHHLCKYLGISIPKWARKYPTPRPQSYLSIVRNDFFHEAHFGEEPVGFAHLRYPNMLLELRHLNARLIVSLLGISCSYTSTSVTTRMQYPLGVP